MRCERVWQAEDRGELRAIGAGPQDPERYVETLAWDGMHLLTRLRPEIAHQLDDVLRKLIDITIQSPADRPHRHLVRPRRAAETEFDAARMQRRQRPELLGNQQRRVVRQHDAAGADADAVGAGGDMG